MDTILLSLQQLMGTLLQLLGSLLLAAVLLVVSVIAHEGGHLVAGLLSGYRFASFRIFSWVWAKVDGKVTFSHSPNRAVAGQCLMLPPQDEADFRYIFYNYGGGLANLLLALLFVLGWLVAGGGWPATIIVIGIFLNIYLAVMNLLPLNLGIPNDGMNVKYARKSAAAAHGFYLMLYLNGLTMEGKRYREMEPALFQLSSEADLYNYMAIYPLMCYAARLYDLGRYEETIQVYRGLQLDKLPAYYQNAIYMDYLYYYTVHNPNYGEAQMIYQRPKFAKYLSMDMPGQTRVLAAYRFFVEGNRVLGRQLLEKSLKQIQVYPNPGLRQMETDYLEALKAYMDAAENQYATASAMKQF